MKKQTLLLIAILSSLIATNISATSYYVSPTGSGTGTIASPLSFASALSKTLNPGDSVIMRGGMYSNSSTITISKIGTAAKQIHFIAYPGETPIFDFRTQAYSTSSIGIKVSGDYIHIKGIIVQGAGDNGMQVTGTYNLIEQCTFRWNCDSGLQMKSGSATCGNTILNCDSYENFDYKSMNSDGTPNYGGNADGFADKQYTTTVGVNLYKGCRSWRNADDGWDHYQRVGTTQYDSCWCHANGPASFDMKTNIRFKTDSASWFYQFKSANFIVTNYGNGNGFKLGGANTAHNATLTRCISVFNKVKGFDQNNNDGTMTLYNCSGTLNSSDYGFSNNNYGTLIIKNCVSISSKSSNSLSCKSVTQSNNTWQSGFSCTTNDFVSLDYSGMTGARGSDGALPILTLLHLKSTSTLINKGINLGLPFVGSAPDLGAYEYSATTAIENTKSNNSISIYPNPVQAYANIKLEGNSNEEVIVAIYDLSGRILFSKNLSLQSGSNLFDIDTQSLAKGNYICRIYGQTIDIRTKLVK